MSNAAIRRLIGGLGTVLILLICGVVIVAHFLTARNLQRIDVSTYTTIKSDGAGGYTAELDIDRLIYQERLSNPPESELDRYPEIKALRGLSVRITQRGDAYEVETITTGEDPTALLKKHGIRLVNTKWTIPNAELENAPAAQPEGSKGLDFATYVWTNVAEDGTYRAVLDLRSLMNDAGVDLNADPETDVGARALRSLGVSCELQDGVYQMRTISNLPTVMEDLKTAGLKIVHTQWNWTAEEMEAHRGVVIPLDTPETPDPAAEADNPDIEETDAPEATDPVTEVPDETPKPERNPNAIDTLYGFDQTEVRKAIRAAKEQKYGSSIEGSEIKYNYFAVGGDSAPYGNVFRIVYTITTSSGTEYLIADVYDLESETGYTVSDVHLTVETDSSAARKTDDLSDYTVHTLYEGSMVFPENRGKSPFDGDGLVMPKSISEAVSYDELWDIPATDDLSLLKLLGYARNEMFARGGHKFGDSSNYLKYYKQFSWYKPTGTVSADDLAAMFSATKNNITRIKFLEKLIKEG